MSCPVSSILCTTEKMVPFTTMVEVVTSRHTHTAATAAAGAWPLRYNVVPCELPDKTGSRLNRSGFLLLLCFWIVFRDRMRIDYLHDAIMRVCVSVDMTCKSHPLSRMGVERRE